MTRSVPTLASPPRSARPAHGGTPTAPTATAHDTPSAPVAQDSPSADAALRPRRPRRDPNGLARLHAAAAARGGECLDDFCAKLQAKYRFRCAQGHEWLGWGHLILVGKWCRLCANQRMRRTIEDMREVARQRGGLCLSTEYRDCESKLTWQCAIGHVWEAAPRNVHSRRTWCPHCARLNKGKQPATQPAVAPRVVEPAVEPATESASKARLESAST
ncbi:hypothetical protein [Paraburkholderia sp.]|uniref:hypothetical protein n=1 Tax=Paraburkholderia sp. TaxID=1926495 RepID=UPI003D6E50FD